MKGEEFLNKMELIDSAFIEQADTIPKKKKGAADFSAAPSCEF